MNEDDRLEASLQVLSAIEECRTQLHRALQEGRIHLCAARLELAYRHVDVSVDAVPVELTASMNLLVSEDSSLELVEARQQVSSHSDTASAVCEHAAQADPLRWFTAAPP